MPLTVLSLNGKIKSFCTLHFERDSMETIFDELVENVLEAVRKFLMVFHVILGITGVVLTLMTYQTVTSGTLHFGPADVEAGHTLLAGFVGFYMIVMIILKLCRLPATAEGIFLGLPLGVATSFLLLQKMNVPLHVFIDVNPLIAVVILLGVAAWVPYPAKT